MQSKAPNSMGSCNTRHLVITHLISPPAILLIFFFSHFFVFSSSRTGVVWEVLVDNEDSTAPHSPPVSH